MNKQWTAAEVLQLASSYQGACVLAAAADLDLFHHLTRKGAFSAEEATARLHTDLRGTMVLLDALTAMGLLEKAEGTYCVPPTVAELLTDQRPGNVLAMAQHQANCLRHWAQLGRVVKTGRPAERVASIRGAEADHEAFIEAMDNISAPKAPEVVAALQPLAFTHLLDVGGATGTWALEFLRHAPQGRATIFDLPEVVEQAKARIAASGLAERVTLAAGSYLSDPLPGGCDLAWVSAIIHSLSREQCRELYRRCFGALVAGGQLLLRDFLMEPSHTAPAGGTMFAVNMLVGTERGGTYSVEEIRADLEGCGFQEVRVLRNDQTMNAVLGARKP